jgi:hypothetical protein
MLKLELPFHLTEFRDERLFRSSVAQSRVTTSEIVLMGLSIGIETGGKTCEICSDDCPDSDTPSFRGTVWPRSLLPLSREMSVEQQMFLPAGGNAVAISWRLVGQALSPARLRVSPIFIAGKPISAAKFEIEPEPNGGRLAWRPYDHCSKIIADTNGRCAGGTSFFMRSGRTSSIFEFDLGSRPAVLIFSAELESSADANPLIGGFLAQLAEHRTAMTEYDHRRDLVAA